MTRSPHTPEELQARREARRHMYLRRRIGAVAVLLVFVIAASFGMAALVHALTGSSSGSSANGGSGTGASPKPTAALPMVNGSLGDANTQLACTLLTKQQIAKQFGGPVSEPIPVYPTCRWEIGKTGFVSVLVAPGVPLDQIPAHAPETVRASAAGYGLGSGAYFGINRVLYFANDTASYWVMYQKVADFISIADTQLGALARDILAEPLPDTAKPTTKLPEVTGVRLGPATEIGSPTAQDPLHVFYAGDSLAAGPSWGLYDVTQDVPTVQVDAEYEVGSGMTRDDFFDWYRHLAGIAAGLHPPVLIWQSGANDRQPLRVNGQLVTVYSEAWNKEYRRRIDAYMKALTGGGRQLFWVGLPPMDNSDAETFSKKANQMYQEEAAKFPGVTFVDTYRLLSGPNGGYTYQLTVNGTLQPVRTPDGLHLNVAGSLLLAHQILTQLGDVTGVSTATASPTPSDGASAAPSATPTG